QLHGLRVDDDDVIARVDEWRVRRLVLALEDPRGPGGDAAQHLSVRVNQMPADAWSGAGYERRHSRKFLPRKQTVVLGCGSERDVPSARPGPTTTNPNDMNVSRECQARTRYSR